ncbi:DUF7168 domain-containing protein [Azospirillum canadense]|uniref:DUF7168 domain-containing protein n=1 Tax=Azospirillum canadense TaxID=403962 RepID=UPI00222715A7|nr:DUF2786 domain-containing protein [Azospirillum canadense]MCW2242553.1 hypothetical protein [Azospirillum canadense]
MTDISARAGDLGRLKARTQALRAKTVENGCTEQEAWAAAAKVAELLDQHDLSLSDIEIREEACERAVVETHRKQRVPLDGCVNAIAVFCDCRVWREKNGCGEFRYVFFGLSPDATVAQYITDLVSTAMHTEVERFKRTKDYLRYHPDDRRTVRTAFLHGMAASVAEKLADMKSQRDAANATTGRDLVVVKTAVVEEELAKLNLNLRKSRSSGRSVTKNAFEAGQTAGRKLAIYPGVSGEVAARLARKVG